MPIKSSISPKIVHKQATSKIVVQYILSFSKKKRKKLFKFICKCEFICKNTCECTCRQKVWRDIHQNLLSSQELLLRFLLSALYKPAYKWCIFNNNQILFS